MLLVLARYVAHIVCDLETLQSSCEFRYKWLASVGKQEKNNVSVCKLYLVKQQSTDNIFHFIGQAGLTSGY